MQLVALLNFVGEHILIKILIASFGLGWVGVWKVSKSGGN